MDFGPAAYTMMNRKVWQEVKDLYDALADLWIDMLEREHISYCMWTFSKVAEPCSAVRSENALMQAARLTAWYTSPRKP